MLFVVSSKSILHSFQMGVLRFLLAISVVLFHFGGQPTLMVGGGMAVQAFYVVSGFYMSLILNEKYLRGSYALYISNRLLRLYPLYLAVLLGSVAVFATDTFWFSYPNPLEGIGAYSSNFSVGTWLYVVGANLLIIGQDVSQFLGLDAQSGALYFTKTTSQTQPVVSSFMLIGQAWTIGIEILFYLVAPFIVRKKMGYLLLFLLASLALRFVIYSVLGMKYAPWTNRFFPLEMAYFLLGSICYKVYLIQKKWKVNRLFLQVSFATIILFTIGYSSIFASITNVAMLQSILHASYIGCFVGLLPFVFRFTAKNNLDRQIGELSYPIYLLHGLVLYLNARWQLNSLLFVLVLTVVLSVLLDRFLLQKIETYRQKRTVVVPTV